MQRAVQLEHERRLADEEAARLEAERQAAILAKEELARQAKDQLKSQEQLVRTERRFLEKLRVVYFPFNNPPHSLLSGR